MLSFVLAGVACVFAALCYAEFASCLPFVFNATATTEIYTLSLHDALPICRPPPRALPVTAAMTGTGSSAQTCRADEHTSELQSRVDLVCRLLLEKTKM